MLVRLFSRAGLALARRESRRGAAARRHQSTVFALSSGQGKCGVAVIRVTGPASAKAMLTLTGEERLPAARRAVVRPLYSATGLLDRALLLWLPGPHSFTGEDCCELHTHGGPAVVAAVLRALSAVDGLRPAQPGDFTRRAFHNGKMDVTQVEGLADLIHAETEAQRRQAVRQADGQLRQLHAAWRSTLLSCLAAVEAFIDFSEDEQIEAGVLRTAADSACRLAADMERLLGDGRRGERLRSGVQVTIAGAPNVGKSSLLNVLLRRDAAIVSPTPGTTRDILDTVLDVAGYPVLLTDTAGLRDASDAVEQEGVRRARRSADTADLVLLVVDARLVVPWLRPADPSRDVPAFVAEHMTSLALTGPRPAVNDNALARLVLNKADLLSDAETARVAAWAGAAASLVSCLRGDGLQPLVTSLELSLRELCESGGDGPQLTRERHRHHVAAASRHLRRFVAQLADDSDLALAAEQLRRALRELGHVTGHVSSEAILDVIFRDFCIGK